MTLAIDSTAMIGASVKLGRDVRIGPFSILHDGVVVGDDAQIGAHCELGGNGGQVSVGSAARVRKGCAISGDVQVGDRAQIGENAMLQGRVRLSEDVLVDASSSLRGDVSIGERTHIFYSCSIGAAAQHPDFPTAQGAVRIGRRCVVREFVTIHLPTTDALTRLGDECYIMAGCHINHDCRLGDDVKMANSATLAGHVNVGDHAYLGMHSVVHQRIRIGAYTMIGMNAVVVRHVPPYATVIGRRFAKINRIGLETRNVDAADINAIEAHYGNRIDKNAPKSAWIERIETFEAECGFTNVMPPQFRTR
jgi:UDP-N-acetylglucosamine acyltransferase